MLGRREALKFILLAATATALDGCAPGATRPTATPEPTPTPVPNPDFIKQIPDWTLEAWRVNTLQEVTGLISAEERKGLYHHTPAAYSRREEDVFTFFYRGGNNYATTNWGYVYVEKGETVYAGFGQYGHDQDLLRWSQVSLNHPESASVSSNKKVAYAVLGTDSTTNEGGNALVLVDIEAQTKTIMRMTDSSYTPYAVLSDNGEYIALGGQKYADNQFHTQTIPTRILRVADYQVIAELPQTTLQQLNNYGTKALAFDIASRQDVVVNLDTGEKTNLNWLPHYRHYDMYASPDFTRFATRIGMFPSSRTEAGQWGILVKTPDGQQQVLNSSKVSLVPLYIDDDGTIAASNGLSERYILQPNNEGKYTYATNIDTQETVSLEK